MYNKHYTIEWVGTTFWGRDYSDSKRFESGEEKEMAEFLFDLAHNSEVRTYWKTTLEEWKKDE